MSIQKIHIFLDTSVLSHAPKRDNAAFGTITRLAVNKDAIVHLSDVTFREFVSQEEAHFKTSIEEIRKALKALQRRIPASESVLSQVESNLTATVVLEKRLNTSAQTSLLNWLRVAGAEIYTPKSDHIDRVLTSYFQGTPPFKNKKSRDDFPDAFILAALQDLLAVHKSLHAIIADIGLRKAAEALDGVVTYASLDEFVKASTCQERILAINVRQNIDKLRCYLRCNPSILDPHIEEHLESSINGNDVESIIIPDDNNTAIITGSGTPENITFDIDRAEYYGKGVIVVPFSAETEILADYFIFKGDYYSLDDDRIGKIHICDSEWNDHYMAVQEYFNARIAGAISFTIQESLLTNETFDADSTESAILDADGTIDEVHEITIIR